MVEYKIIESLSEIAEVELKDGDIIYFIHKFGFIVVVGDQFKPVVGVHKGEYQVVHLLRGSEAVGEKSELEDYDGDEKFTSSMSEWDNQKIQFFSDVEDELGTTKYDDDSNKVYYEQSLTTLSNAETVIDSKLSSVETIKDGVKESIRNAYI